MEKLIKGIRSPRRDIFGGRPEFSRREVRGQHPDGSPPVIDDGTLRREPERPTDADPVALSEAIEGASDQSSPAIDPPSWAPVAAIGPPCHS